VSPTRVSSSVGAGFASLYPSERLWLVGHWRLAVTGPAYRGVAAILWVSNLKRTCPPAAARRGRFRGRLRLDASTGIAARCGGPE